MMCFFFVFLFLDLCVRTNISSLFYCFDDLMYLGGSPQNKPKVIGIMDCILKANRIALGNIDLQNYTFKWETV